MSILCPDILTYCPNRDLDRRRSSPNVVGSNPHCAAWATHNPLGIKHFRWGVAPRQRGALLLVLREAQVQSAVAGVEPAGGDDLVAGVEVEALGAVGVGVPEKRGLPAAEGVITDRHRNRHVDADHADLDLILVSAGGPAVVGEDRGAVAIGVGGHQFPGGGVGLY